MMNPEATECHRLDRYRDGAMSLEALVIARGVV
jgi:hypothetical protein